jgi:uncharacterized membrane protein
MYSKAKIMGHPIHPMLVAFPIVFYTVSLICFVAFQYFGNNPFWYQVAYVSNFAGIATALLAAIPGFIDWAFGIPRGVAAKRRGLIHMSLNVTALVLFAINAYLIFGTFNNVPSNATTNVILSAVGVVVTLAAGYHGWALIGVHKVGVDLTKEQERIEPVHEFAPHGAQGKPRAV